MICSQRSHFRQTPSGMGFLLARGVLSRGIVDVLSWQLVERTAQRSNEPYGAVKLRALRLLNLTDQRGSDDHAVRVRGGLTGLIRRRNPEADCDRRRGN